MNKSELCKLLGIDRPLVLAPMGGAVGPDFTARFSNLGGLGLIPLWRADGAAIEKTVSQIHQATNKPFGVNLNVEFLKDDQLAACRAASVPVVSLFWGFSAKAVETAKEGGAKVIVSVGTATEAKEAVEAGADVICAQGWEAGGHVWGKVATLALVPAVVDAIADKVPVIAAGGISDRRGVAAAVALGASGVWVGTRFLAAEEMAIHPHYRERLLGAGEDDSAWAHELFDGTWPDAPHRALKNTTYDQWVKSGMGDPGARPDEGKVIGENASGGPVYLYDSATPGPNHKGDIEAMSMWSGQGVAQVRRVQPLAEIMDELETGFEVSLPW